MGWVGAALLVAAARGQDASVDTQLRALADQNRRLQDQVREQQRAIEELRGELHGLQDRVEAPVEAPPSGGSRGHEVRVSGQTGVAYFKTGAAGQFPNGEFRIDDAKVFFEAPVAKNVYVFAGLDLQMRETSDENFHLGEFYVDFENVSGAWARDRLVNVRAGRINTPFGEEYDRRSPVANPLVSHSVADVWGIDEGVEVYGQLGAFTYVLAAQNGGLPQLHDFDSDKAVTARIGYDPARWLHLSASAMRTGRLNTKNDALSALWFGNGFFRTLGAAATTTTFAVDLAEADAAAHWKGGTLRAAAGTARYDDNDSTRSNARRLRYYSLEGVQDLGEKWFAAARLSEVRVARGYPLVGWGNFGTFMFAGPPTTDLRRLSLGLGYRISRPVVLKFEYAFERGRLTNGVERDHENLLSTELALQF